MNHRVRKKTVRYMLFPKVMMLRLVCLCIFMTLFYKGKKNTVEGSLCFKQGQGEGIA